MVSTAGEDINHNDDKEQFSGRQKRKLAYRSRHRLLSIERDSTNLKQRVLSALCSDKNNIINNGSENARVYAIDEITCSRWTWLPNKQCGSWYLPLAQAQDSNESSTITNQNQTEVYFKSTDGHVGTYAISLKRLNLPLLEILHQHGGCFLVDSSVRKILPDSFSRTIPIWCSVINRIVLKYRADLGMEYEGVWDTQLYTPSSIISSEEHSDISNLIDSRVELLYQSKAIVDPRRLVQIMTKPVRAVWIANGVVQHDTIPCTSSADEFFTIVCCNPSYYNEGSSSKNHVHWLTLKSAGNNDDEEDGAQSKRSCLGGYYYTPGAADDDATWGRRLTAELFWANRERLLKTSMTDDETDAMIDTIVDEWRKLQNAGDGGSNLCKSTMNMDKIGNMNLWIGSRRAGRPPECWENFDAILNVTENEYPEMNQSIQDQQRQHGKVCHYLQLPVQEGKKDKTELEHWMPVGLIFLMKHLQQKRRILVHCAQGRDRSVGMVLAFVTLVCLPVFPLQLRPEFESLDIEGITDSTSVDCVNSGDTSYLQSGLANSLVNVLLKKDGRDVFLKWMHQQLNTPSDQPFTNKDSLRVVLHLVSQDRENAEPTRSTMQKLNRFFMSSPLYRPNNSKR